MRNLQTPSFRFAGPALCALSLFLSASQAQPSVDYYPPKPQAVATFESIGITWMLGGHNIEATVEVRYRPEGANAWNEAMPLWYDARDGEARGSIVNLTPGETYQIELRWQEEEATARFSANTWEETFPIAKTVALEPGERNRPLVIAEGGSASEGYVLYSVEDGADLVIDVRNQHPHNVEVRAPFVIVRGLKLTGAQRDAVLLGDVHDVVIENCDITNWGRRHKAFGYNFDSGIKSMSPELERIVVQNNRIHHPRHGSNDWTQMSDLPEESGYHPLGPQGISWADSRGNHVIRHNEIYSDSDRRFNDAMGWWTNFSRRGFPGPNSDIYGNYISHCADDGIESEGSNRNVRIWGNYIERSLMGIATCAVSEGPAYIFRNVFSTSYWTPYADGNSDAKVAPGHVRERGHPPGLNRGAFAKVGEMRKGGSGRQYWLHNTILQPSASPGNALTLGPRLGVRATGKTRKITQLVSLNNIWHVAHTPEDEFPARASINAGAKEPSNTFDFDLYNGTLKQVPAGSEVNGIRAVPTYSDGHGPESGPHGRYQLAPGSPGRDQGKRIPNFNDAFQGQAPDVGAHEGGAPPMRFGPREKN